MRFTGGLLHYFRRWLLQKALLCRNGLKDVPVMKIMYVSEDLFRKLGSASENIIIQHCLRLLQCQCDLFFPPCTKAHGASNCGYNFRVFDCDVKRKNLHEK